MVAIGRDPGNDLVLDDASVSRRHAEIRRESGSFYIYDRGSLNRTYVHRIRIDRTRLADGDELQLGRTRLIFWSGEIKGAGDPH